jgi:hypothetical protein
MKKQKIEKVNITIPAEPLIRAYGNGFVREVLRHGKRIRKGIVRIPAVEFFEILNHGAKDEVSELG